MTFYKQFFFLQSIRLVSSFSLQTNGFLSPPLCSHVLSQFQTCYFTHLSRLPFFMFNFFKLSNRFSHLHTEPHLHTKFQVKIYKLACTIFFFQSRPYFLKTQNSKPTFLEAPNQHHPCIFGQTSHHTLFPLKTCSRFQHIPTLSKTAYRALGDSFK